MEPMKISKTHWSYRLISFAFGVHVTEQWSRYYNIDSCKYNQKVFWASVWIAVATLFSFWYGAAFTTSAILVTIIALNTSIPWSIIFPYVSNDLHNNYGMIWVIQFIVIFVSVAAPLVFSIVGGVWWAIFKISDRFKQNKSATVPSKTKELYTAWKEKYCVPVEFE